MNLRKMLTRRRLFMVAALAFLITGISVLMTFFQDYWAVGLAIGGVGIQIMVLTVAVLRNDAASQRRTLNARRELREAMRRHAVRNRERMTAQETRQNQYLKENLLGAVPHSSGTPLTPVEPATTAHQTDLAANWRGPNGVQNTFADDAQVRFISLEEAADD